MVKLQDLPTELLAHIVSYVGVDGPLDGSPYIGGSRDDWESIGHDEEVETEALYNLCLVSRKFCALAQPVLCEHFVEEHLFGDYQSLVTFTRTVTLRPDLGACVQTIDTSSTGWERPPMTMPGMPHPLSIKSEDLEVFKQAVRDLQVRSEEQTRWFKAIENRDFSMFMALLLSKTPNIHSLVLPAGELFVKPVSHLFTQIPSFLSKLKSIVLAGDTLYSGYDIAGYRDFFSLPLLEDVIVDYGDLVEAKCPSFAPGSLPFQSLFFKFCHIDTGSMQRLVRGCKELTSFALTNFARNPRDGRFDHGDITQFNAAQLHAELLAHKDTLKKLHFEENYPDSTEIGSLRDFPVLDQISIQHQLLPPKPQFPPSLKTLFITDCNTSIRDMAQHIADDCRKGLLPALKTVKVLSLDITQPIKLPGQRIPTGQTPEQCFLSIKNKFRGTNVDFDICPYVVDEDDSDDEYDDGLDPYDYEHNQDSDDDLGPMGDSRMANALLRALMSQGSDMRHIHEDPFD